MDEHGVDEPQGAVAVARSLVEACRELRKENAALPANARERHELEGFAQLEEIRHFSPTHAEEILRHQLVLAEAESPEFFVWFSALFERFAHAEPPISWERARTEDEWTED